MRRRFTILAALVALIGLLALSTGRAVAAPATVGSDPSALPVTGTGPNGSVYQGELDISRFAEQDGQLVAVGTLTGTLTDTAGTVIAEGAQQVTLPVAESEAGIQATCDILNLVLGPLDLDLLGLQVHLDQVVLDITAESGPGNLLGNLLCAIAGLLDGPTVGLGQLISLLNQILDLLG